MEIEQVENLLDYVFTPGEGDFNLNASTQEYKKLQRIMTVMIRFYKRGSDSKSKQLEQLREEMGKLLTDEGMIKDQIKALEEFPPIHPKRGEYEGQLEEELERLEAQKQTFKPQEDNFTQLYEWSLKIVSTVEWLGKQLEAYCNQELKTDFEVTNSGELTVDEYRIFKRGLDEITFNLQESMDFFNASLDGRLQRFHQLEKCMIEAQLQAIRKYPEDNARRQHVEAELVKDLEYVKDNMKEDPQVVKHRERMRQMHNDFFSLLKWQREKIIRMPYDEPEKLKGDVEALKAELETSKKDNVSRPEEELPTPVASEPGVCPVPHVAKAMAAAAAQQQQNGDGQKSEFNIHRLYDKKEHGSLYEGTIDSK